MRATCAFRPRALRGFCSASAPPVLGPKAVLALRALGIKAIEPSGAALFDAQRACWPLLDAGMPTFVAAPTGTGKSVLAVLRACTVAGTREEGAASIHAVADLALPRALVIAPTRELAAQHVDCARLMLEQVAPGARVALIAGGEKHAVQRRTLASTSPALVIGTPGRILAHVAQNHLSLHRVRCVVLDEADSLLSPDGGFWLELRQLLQLLQSTPAGRKDAKDEEARAAALAAAEPARWGGAEASGGEVRSEGGGLDGSGRATAHESSGGAHGAAAADAAQPAAASRGAVVDGLARAVRERARRPPRVQLLFTAATADVHTLERATLIAPRLSVPTRPPQPQPAQPNGDAPGAREPPEVLDGSAPLDASAADDGLACLQPSIKHDWLKLLRPGDSKMRALSGYIKAGCAPTLVFTNSMASCMAAWRSLWERGLDAARLHGGMEPAERDAALAKLRSGAACVLVTTDVAMRGLDLPRVSRVINFDFPESAQQFVHRVGRTGRAGAKGTAVHLLGSHADWLLSRQLRDPRQLRALLAAGPAEASAPATERRTNGTHARAADSGAKDEEETDAARGVRKAGRARYGAARAAALDAAALAELEEEEAERYAQPAATAGGWRNGHRPVERGGAERGVGRERGGEQRAPAAVGGAYSLRGEAGRGRVVLRTKGRRLREEEAEREQAEAGVPRGAVSQPVRFVRSAYTPSLRSARSKSAPGSRGAAVPAEHEYVEERYVEFGAGGEALERVRRVRRVPSESVGSDVSDR